MTAATLAVAQTPLNQQQARPSPAWLTGGVIYQIQPRAFTPEGTLKAAQARLPRLAELGVTIAYLCPIFVSDDDMDQAFWSPRQKKSGMNNPRNPYRMKDFYHVDPEYGTDQDLKDFVAAAHALKLRVMLDMVYLHCGPKAVFIESNPDFVKRSDDGKIKNAGWSFPGLNFASPALREYLWKNMEMWVRDFDVDGFRCDVADQIPLDFWVEGRARLERIKPDVGMLAEGMRKEDQLKAFDLDYGWGRAFSQLEDGAAIRKLWTTRRDERPRGGAKFARFIDNTTSPTMTTTIGWRNAGARRASMPHWSGCSRWTACPSSTTGRRWQTPPGTASSGVRRSIGPAARPRPARRASPSCSRFAHYASQSPRSRRATSSGWITTSRRP